MDDTRHGGHAWAERQWQPNSVGGCSGRSAGGGDGAQCEGAAPVVAELSTRGGAPLGGQARHERRREGGGGG